MVNRFQNQATFSWGANRVMRQMDSEVEEQKDGDRTGSCLCCAKTSGLFTTRPRFPHVYWTSASRPARFIPDEQFR